MLRQTHEAMKDSADYSRLLIYESVLPDVGCGFLEAQVDMLMMISCDGIERNGVAVARIVGKMWV